MYFVGTHIPSLSVNPIGSHHNTLEPCRIHKFILSDVLYPLTSELLMLQRSKVLKY